MNLSALIAAAYVEVQRTTGVKPDVRARFNRLLRRPTERDFRALRHFQLPPGQCCVDAGANRGETIASVRLYLPQAPIVAFEPNPLLIDLIRRRNDGDARLTLHPAGLGASEGEFKLHVPHYKGVPFDGLASFNLQEAEQWLSPERLAGFDARHQEIKTFDCRVARLDSYGLAPAFMKIDVQGYEAAVVSGAEETLARHKPVVLMENNDPVRDAVGLARLGYGPHAFDGHALNSGKYGELNTYYIHPETRGLFAEMAYA